MDKKKRGRPATGKEPLTAFRMPEVLKANIIAWQEGQPEPRPSFSEAIRRLIEIALDKVSEAK